MQDDPLERNQPRASNHLAICCSVGSVEGLLQNCVLCSGTVGACMSAPAGRQTCDCAVGASTPVATDTFNVFVLPLGCRLRLLAHVQNWSSPRMGVSFLLLFTYHPARSSAEILRPCRITVGTGDSTYSDIRKIMKYKYSYYRLQPARQVIPFLNCSVLRSISCRVLANLTTN